MKSVDYAIRVNYIENMLHKLWIVIPVLKRLVTLILMDIYAPLVILISVINGKILTLELLEKS
jgi:hypothetical protein